MKVFRWFGIVLLVLSIVLVAGVFALHTPPARRYVLAKLESTLKASGVNLHASSLSYNLLGTSVEFRDLRVASDAPGLPSLLEADRVYVRLATLSLFRGVIRITDGFLDRPTIRLAFDAAGRSNIPGGDGKAAAEPVSDANAQNAPRFEVARFQVRDAALALRHDPSHTEVRLPLWHATIGDSGTPTTRVEFELEHPGEAVAGGRLIPIDRLLLRAGLGLEGQTVKLEAARLESAGSEISLQGSAANVKSPHVSVRADARLALANLAELAAVGQSAAGELTIHANAEGPLDAIRAQFELAGGHAPLRYGEFSASRFSAEGAYDGTANEIYLNSLNLGVSGGTVQAEGTLALASGDSSLRARVSNVNLEQLAQALGLEFSISSRATGTVAASWPDTKFRQADGRALVRFARIRAQPQEGRVPLSGDVEALISKGRVTLLLGPGASTAGQRPIRPVKPLRRPEDLRQKPRGIRGISAVDRTAVLIGTAYRPAAHSPRLQLASAGTPVKAESTISAWLRRFALGLPAQQPNQNGAPPGPMNALEALGSIMTGQVTIAPSGQLSGRLSAHIRDLGELVSSLNAVTGGAVPLTAALAGEADVIASISGDTEAPVIDVRTTAPSVQVGRFQGLFADVSAVYSPEQLTIRSALIRQQNQLIEAHGVLALADNGPMDLAARVTDLQFATVLDAIGRADLPVSGMVSLEANVKGTRQQPQADLMATASDLQAYGEPWGRLELEAELAEQRLELRRMELQKTTGEGEDARDAGSLTATAAYDLQSQHYTLDLTTSDLRLNQIAAGGHAISGVLNASVKGEGTLDQPMLSTELNVSDFLFDTQDPAKQLSGNFRATINASGDRREPRDLNVELQADQIALTGNGFDLRAASPIRAAYKTRTLTVDAAALEINDGRVTVDGSLPLEPAANPGDLRLTAALELRSAYRLVPFLEASSAMGMLDVDLHVRGSIEQPAPEGAVTLRDASLSPRALRAPLEQLQVTVGFKDRQIVLEQVTASWAGASIAAQGVAPLAVLAPSLAGGAAPANAAVELNADVTGIQLASLSSGSRGTDVGGAVSLHFEARAPSLQPGDVTANLRFEELNANVGGIRIDQQGKSSISLSGGTVTIDQFLLAGPETKIEASGTAQVIGDRNLNVRLTANTNASLATIFLEGGQVAGLTTVELEALGTLSTPDLRGFATIQDGHFAIDPPSIAATNMNLRVDFAGDRFEIREASGNLNGGDLRIGGAGSLRGGTLQDTSVTVAGNDVYMEFPQGLLTVSEFDLNMDTRGEFLVLGGRASVQDGTFRRNINVQAGVINLLQSGSSSVDLSRERSEFLSRVRYNVALETPTAPIVIDNNLGKFAVLTNVRLVGSYYQPSMIGRIQLSEAGELYLNGNTFYIERGVATFVSEQQIQPEVDLLAHTRVAGYDITMSVTGPAGKITTTLTSDPPLPESDIVSVLLVGRPLKDVRGAEAEVASQQLLSYVAGGLGSAFSSQLQEVFGFSQVRVEPVLVAGETTPDARLTIGQNLTSDLSLTYSRSMIDGGNDIWIGEYDAMRSLVGRITKQEDNSYRFDLNNDWQFGGTPLLMARMMQDQKRVAAVRFTGMPLLTEEELRDKLKVNMGDDFDFFKLRKGAARIEETLHDRERLEAQVRLGTTTQDVQTDVNVNVQAGPTVRFAFEGWQPSRGLRGRIRDIWQDGIFDLQRSDQAVDAIREELAHDGYLQAEVTNSVEMPAPDQKLVMFHVEQKQRFEQAGLTFPGAARIAPDELSDALSDAGLRNRVLIEPNKTRSLVERYYADRGYLGAQVDLPRVEISGNRGSIAIPVSEGPLYHFRSVSTQGNQAYPTAEIVNAAEIAEGTIYAPETLDAAVSNIQKLYTDHGYNDAVINYNLQRDDATAGVNLLFRIDEGRQHVVRQIVVSGNRETSENMILGQLRLRTGDVLITPEVSRARSNLYQTGAFQLIELNQVVADDPYAAAYLQPNQVPVDLHIVVHEIQPYRILAGGYYDTDRGPGAIVDISNRNSLGSAKVLGLRLRADHDLQESRLYFSQPFLSRFPVRSLGSTYFTREVKDAFIDDRIGVSFGQEARLGNDYLLNYSYRIERVRVWNLTDSPLASTEETERSGTPGAAAFLADASPIPPFGSLSRRLAPLTATLSRDTRDDILNATRGQFVSHAFAIGFNFLGSQQQYLKYFVQYFRFIPLSEPEPVPFKPNLKKARYLYAGGVRFGIGRGLAGQNLIQSERFFAGGGTTIRGFKQDQVGPQSPVGVPVGGNALFILNNEVRFPLWNFIGGAAFIDAGNIYPRIRDFNPIKIRAAAGFGLRLTTPWVMIRGDYGLKLGRHQGESAGAFFVSIGQAF